MSMPAHLPKGDYPAAAALHILDLDAEADRLLAKLPGHRRQAQTLARESGTSVVLMAVEAGDEIQEHSAKSPVSIQVMRGHVNLKAAGQAVELRSGQLAFLQPEVAHGLVAIEQSVVLLTLAEA